MERSARMGEMLYLDVKASVTATRALAEHLGGPTPATGGSLVTRDAGTVGEAKASCTVHFLTRGSQPRISFRVQVPSDEGGRAVVEEVNPPAAPGERLAVLIRARQTAMAQLKTFADLDVPPAGYTPVVLAGRNVGQEEILVYLLAPKTQADVVVFGRHYRVLVTADGRHMVRIEPMSRSNLRVPLSPPTLPKGALPVALVVSHDLSDFPLESHVFVSLLEHIPVDVVTPHGDWHVDGARIEFFGERAPPAAKAPPAAAVPPVQVTGPSLGDTITLHPGDDFFVVADERNGALGNFRRIDRPPVEAAAKDVLHVAFARENKGGRNMMVLTLVNLFSRPIVYQAQIHDAAAPPGQLSRTSTCPVRTFMRSLETWPQPITLLKLQDFHFGFGNEPC